LCGCSSELPARSAPDSDAMRVASAIAQFNAAVSRRDEGAMLDTFTADAHHRLRPSKKRLAGDHRGTEVAEDELMRFESADRIEDFALEADVVADDDGVVRSSFDLPMPGLSLLTLSSGASGAPASDRLQQ